MSSTAKEVYDYLRESEPDHITNRELQRVLPHRSVGAIGGALYRLSEEGVLVAVDSDGNGYVYAVVDLDVPVKFNSASKDQTGYKRNDGAHAKRKKFRDNARIQEALAAIFDALVILEEELK
jgi:hypothetical protein